MQKFKISGFQVVSILFLSRIFNVLTFMPAFSEKYEATTILWGNVVNLIFQCILIIPAIIFYDIYKEKNVVTLAYEKFRKFGVIIAAFYFIITLTVCLSSISNFRFFMVNTVFTDVRAEFLVITMCIASFYAAYVGLQGVARMGTIVLVLFSIGIIFVLIGSSDLISWINITPNLSDNFNDVIRNGIENVSKSSEIILLILFYPNVKASFKKCSFSLIAISFVVIEIIAIVGVLVLGSAWKDQMFPYYTLNSVAEISIFQRLDTIHVTMWILISFVRIAIFLIAANWVFQQMIPYKARKYSLLILFPVVLILGLMIANNEALVQIIKILLSSFVLFLVAVIFIPLIFIIMSKKRKGISNEKESIDPLCVNSH